MTSATSTTSPATSTGPGTSTRCTPILLHRSPHDGEQGTRPLRLRSAGRSSPGDDHRLVGHRRRSTPPPSTRTTTSVTAHPLGRLFRGRNHPTWTYRSTGVRARRGPGRDGELTIKGVTRSVPLTVEVGGFGPDAFGGIRPASPPHHHQPQRLRRRHLDAARRRRRGRRREGADQPRDRGRAPGVLTRRPSSSGASLCSCGQQSDGSTEYSSRCRSRRGSRHPRLRARPLRPRPVRTDPGPAAARAPRRAGLSGRARRAARRQPTEPVQPSRLPARLRPGRRRARGPPVRYELADPRLAHALATCSAWSSPSTRPPARPRPRRIAADGAESTRRPVNPSAAVPDACTMAAAPPTTAHRPDRRDGLRRPPRRADPAGAAAGRRDHHLQRDRGGRRAHRGTIASSAALIGFGLDSVIEVSSAAAVAWQFSGRDHEARERAALRVIACRSSPSPPTSPSTPYAPSRRQRGQHSTVGIVLAAVSLAVMPFLSYAQRRAGRELGSPSRSPTPSRPCCAPTCPRSCWSGCCSTALFGWSWADPIAALVIAAVAVKEGRDAWRGHHCC